MALAFVIAVLALAGAAATWGTWWRQADERRSVLHHQHALDTLRHMSDRQLPSRPSTAPFAARNAASDRRQPTTARPSQTAAAPVSAAVEQTPSLRAAAARSTLVASTRATVGQPTASRHAPARAGNATTSGLNGNRAKRPMLVFVDDGLGPADLSRGIADADGDVEQQHDVSEAAARGPQARRGPAPWRMSPAERFRPRARARRSNLVAVAAAALVVVLAVAVGAAVSAGPSHATRSSAARAPRATTASGGAHRSATSGSADQPSAPPSSVGSVAPVAGSATGATYAAPPPSSEIVLRATGPCWVMATQPASGTAVWTGTMTPGSTRTIPADGGLVIRLGAARNVSVWMNDQQVELPAGFRSVFVLTFQA